MMPASDPAAEFARLPQARAADMVINEFAFTSGARLSRLRMHYLTAGALRRDGDGRAANAVLVLHGTTGRALEFMTPTYSGELFRPGQPLDADRFFLIIPDNIGHGDSSKPSDGLRAAFPAYTYADMVAAQYALVRDHLEIDHLRLITGISMGGMHSWMWAARYPAFMDAIAPVAAEPTRITGRNLLWRQILIEAVRRAPEYAAGNYREQPQAYRSIWPMFHMLDDSPRHLAQLVADREDALAYIDGRLEVGHPPVDANDALYAFAASQDYDPEPHLADIRARVQAINFEDDELNPVELGALARLMPQVRHGAYCIVPATDATHGHMTLIQAHLWKQHLTAVLGS